MLLLVMVGGLIVLLFGVLFFGGIFIGMVSLVLSMVGCYYLMCLVRMMGKMIFLYGVV